MREYLIKRFFLMIPTLLGITLVVYAVLLLLPGDPVDVILGQEYDERIAKQLRAEYGLDQPIYVQYAKWLWHIVQGDWGRSMFSRKPVFDEV
ncbi:MAG: ABC transporter permease, partial [Candidatus Entotheonellia bacterium]